MLLVGALSVYNTYFARHLPSGDWGLATVPVSMDSRVARVRTIFPRTPASRAGIVRGDIIRIIGANFFSFEWPEPGAHLSFEVRHGAKTRMVTLTAQKRSLPASPTENVLFATAIAGLLLASLLAWRRWDDPVARPLMLYMVLQAATLTQGNLPGYIYGYIRSPQSILIFLSYAGLLRFTAIYPAEARPSRLRRELAVWGPAITLALGVLFAVVEFSTDWLNVLVPARVEYRYASLLCADLLPLLGLVLGVFSASAPDKRRLIVLLGFFLAGITGPIAYDIILANTSLTVSQMRPLLATLIVIYAGFVYMILRHRMFDIGFVLNRAAIYAVLTTIFVPIFALLEWVAERYVSSQNRAENALLQVGIALVLFTSIRWVHAYAERFVDQWLFRERHENETALRDFARHVLFITDERTITERTVQTICARTEASWSAIYLRDDAGGRYALTSRCGDSRPPLAVTENDSAVVAMRADRTTIERFADSALGEALTLPLFARGRLSGFVACGPKRSGESYAPDERDALMQIAHAVGSALDGVRLTKLEEKIARLESTARLQVQP
jgi:hypothetical protein